MAPLRKNLIQDDDEDTVLLSHRLKKQKSGSGDVATGSQNVAHEQGRKKREEELVKERERKREDEKKKVEERKRVERERKKRE